MDITQKCCNILNFTYSTTKLVLVSTTVLEVFTINSTNYHGAVGITNESVRICEMQVSATSKLCVYSVSTFSNVAILQER